VCCYLDNSRLAGLHSTMRVTVAFVSSLISVVTGCGSSSVPPAAEPVARKAELPRPQAAASGERAPTRRAVRAASAPPAELPAACAGTGRDCYPPVDFVRTLCKNRYPGVAVVMFNKSAPWQHAYVKVKDVAPFNSLGGPSAHTRLEFLEEVVLLRERKPKKQQQMMVVQDLPVSYDVLRFDGTCATLANDEFMTRKPVVRAHYAPVIWQQIDTRVRLALAENQTIAQAAEAQNMACQGTFLAGGGETCRDATQRLTRAIMTVLNEGVDLPKPSKIPNWAGTTTAQHRDKPGCPGDLPC
jgi:hypothetical protein